MANDDKIREEKLQYNPRFNVKQQKYQHYHQVTLIYMDSLQVKNYCHMVKV